MQQFEVEEPMDLQIAGVQRDMLCPVRSEGRYSSPAVVRRIHGLESQKQKKETRQACRRENLPTRDKVQVTAGTSMVSPHQQLLQRHTSRVSK